MPDFAALDVALGLIFVFLVLSLVCSALMETLSSILAWRAAYLKKGLVSLLDEDLMNEVFDHPLVNPLVRPARELSPRLASIPVVRRAVGWWRRERYPSYLPSRTVISALLDLDVEARAREAARTVDDAVARVPNERVREALTTLWRDVRGRVDKKEDQTPRSASPRRPGTTTRWRVSRAGTGDACSSCSGASRPRSPCS